MKQLRTARRLVRQLLDRLGRRLRGQAVAKKTYYGLPHDYLCWIDEPIAWDRLTHRFKFSGWCFSRTASPIHRLRVYLDNVEIPVSHGLIRADVASAYPESREAGHSGFAASIEVPSDDSHMLRLEAARDDGLWQEILRQPIIVPAEGRRGSYFDWVNRYDTMTFRDRCRIRKLSATSLRPSFWIYLTIRAGKAGQGVEAVEAVRKQLYPNWILNICAEKTLSPDEKSRLASAAQDSRIKLSVLSADGFSIALNRNLQLVSGDFVCLLTSDALLSPDALFLLAEAVSQHPEAKLLYGDEDELDLQGCRTRPSFKPDWNWELLLSQDYVSSFVVFEAKVAKSFLFRPEAGHALAYDFLLRYAAQLKRGQICHLPFILIHRTSHEMAGCLSRDEVAAVEYLLARHHIMAKVIPIEGRHCRQVGYYLPPDEPSVSIIIPTRDRVELLQACVESIVRRTTYRNYELILVDNGSRTLEAQGYLAEITRDNRVRVLRQDEPFNFSRLSNCGVAESEAEFVLLMNNDITVITANWLEEMVGYGVQRMVGAVGAQLLYPDNRVQQAGVVLGAGAHEVAEVAHRGIPRTAAGYLSRAILPQEVSAVGAACMLVRRKSYLEVGGFDESNLKIAFNDIDFCLKLRQRGYRIIFCPGAELYHHEHATRGSDVTESNQARFNREIGFMKQKWGKELEGDPYYNPNLSLGRELFVPAFPPRVVKPWRVRTRKVVNR